MRRSCVVALASAIVLVAGVGCGHSARNDASRAARNAHTITAPDVGAFNTGTATIEIPAPGAPLRQRLESALFVHDIAGIGRVARVHCARGDALWTCTVRGANGRRAVCSVAVAGDKLEGAYCNRRR